MIENYGKLEHMSTAFMPSEQTRYEEKIDGSQISFTNQDDKFYLRSRGVEFDARPENDFGVAWDQLCDLDLWPGLVYRGEFLRSPRHNRTKYERTPVRNVILFDIDGHTRDDLEAEGTRLGLEVVPVLARGAVADLEALCAGGSILGGQIEGVVAKGPHPSFKFVTQAYRETSGAKIRSTQNPMQDIGRHVCTEARFHKAVQALRDEGKLTGTGADIGACIQWLHQDIEAECAEEIKEVLYQNYRKGILKAAVAPFAAWYREQM